MDAPSTAIGPGLGAFVAFFVLAVLLWFLMRNMNARMRRMAYAERDRVARLEAEDLAREAAAEQGDGVGDASSGAAEAVPTQGGGASPPPGPPAEGTDQAPKERGAPTA